MTAEITYDNLYDVIVLKGDGGGGGGGSATCWKFGMEETWETAGEKSSICFMTRALKCASNGRESSADVLEMLVRLNNNKKKTHTQTHAYTHQI